MNAPPCRSVFLAPLTVERYTQVWVRLIHQIERTRAAAEMESDYESGPLT